jgi:subtilisin family serine protease
MAEANQGPEVFGPGTTGRTLVALEPYQVEAGANALSEIAEVSIESAEGGEIAAAQLESPEVSLVLPELGVAVVDATLEQAAEIRAAEADPDIPILASAPETIVFALEEPPDEEWPRRSKGEVEETSASELASPTGLSIEYMRGYSDAVQNLMEKLVAGEAVAGELIPAAFDETQYTWGLQATKAATSRFSGRGIKVAVLDTGLDLQHPDFAGRRITSRSFVANEQVQDGGGHGTHCIGTACGSQRPSRLPRYGVAYNADIFAGKVLSNRGSGTDGQILAGIEWAITSGCAVVSMSLGRLVMPGERFNPVFEQAGLRALQRGTLIIAAAGNDSGRPRQIEPVSHPANCPSIMAVGALDEGVQVAGFSNGGRISAGGEVDIAGPGVNVHSSFPRPQLYRRLNGTSMATPHVAGIAALYAEMSPKLRGATLGGQLIQSARRLSLPRQDVGAGLVQAP